MIILEELENAQIKWDISFERSQDMLANLAGEAMSEYRAGKTQDLFLGKL